MEVDKSIGNQTLFKPIKIYGFNGKIMKPHTKLSQLPADVDYKKYMGTLLQSLGCKTRDNRLIWHVRASSKVRTLCIMRTSVPSGELVEAWYE